WTSTLMWVATLAIAGIPPFAGFFSKDQILSAAFSLGDVHPLWYVYWLLGLLTALLTAFYMTRLMLYTFHGPNRTGERESAHLHEAPWVMTGPLVVLAALSLAGGALNVPALLRGREWLEHWLEPVTAVAARLRPGIEVPHGSEWALVIAAVAAAGLGIIAAVRLLRPEELVPARLAPAERGFARVLWKKWYVDEIYDFLFVRPLIWLSREVLWRTIDLGLIDGAGVNGAARLSRALGWIGSRLQTGQLGFYVVLFVGGVRAVEPGAAVRDGSAVVDPLHRRRGRHLPVHGAAHHLARSALGARQLQLHHHPGAGVLRAATRPDVGHDRGVRRPRPVPVLRDVGSDAHPDVLHHRGVARGQPPVCGDPVLHLHDAPIAAHALSHPCARVPLGPALGTLLLTLLPP